MGNKSSGVYCIGYSRYSELGQNITESRKIVKIINGNKHRIIKIISGSEYAIYMDSDNNYWGLGRNTNGELCINKHGKSIQHQTVHNLTRIKYFKSFNINIKQCITNINCIATFWITENGKVYVNGVNHAGRFGEAEYTNIRPYLIAELDNVVDITCNWNYTFVLCTVEGKLDIIVDYIFDGVFDDILLPKDIKYVISQFAKGIVPDHDVFVSTHDYSKNKRRVDQDKKYWVRLNVFNDKDVIKIESWSGGCCFLERNDMIWTMLNGQDGLNEIEFFREKKLKVVDVKCTKRSIFVLDFNGDVWRNKGGEMVKVEGVGDVVEIGCGSRNVFARCKNGKYYIWGDNKYNQCVNPKAGLRTDKPCCINKYVNGEILGVSLGDMNTKIIVA